MTSQQSPGQALVARRPSRLTLDHLLALTMLALIWLFISVLPLPPNDLWWHMAAGRTMVAEGAWMTNNRWAYTLPYDAPYVYQSWLSEVIMYGAWRLGDVPLLTLLRTTAIVAAYGLIAWAALRRGGGNGKAAALAVLVAMLIGWGNWTLRPQTLAFVPGATVIALLSEYAAGRLRRRWLLALPPLIALWVNLHGSFVLGLALVALTWLGLAIAALRAPRAGREEARRRLGALTLAGAGCALAAMLHPLGTGIFGYVRDMVGNAELQDRFVEWQPPRAELNLLSTGFWFYATLFGLAALMATGPRRPSAVEVLWFCGLGWLAVDGVRYAIWFALGVAPLLAGMLADRLGGRPAPAPRAVAAGYLLALGALAVATLPWLSPGSYLGPGAAGIFAESGRHRMLLGSTTPIGASEWLAENPIPGRFWVDQSYSSYTIWRLPEKQVFADLRVELFPRAVWDDYFAISRGDAQSLALLDRWQITHLLIDRRYQEQLMALLRSTPGWCERYRDRDSSVFARCDAR
jgi:hypothetical protein